MAERHNVTPFHSPGTLPSLDTVAFEASPSGEVLIEYAAADLSQAGYSIRLKDLPDGERPRERLFALGPKSLSTAELLAVVLGPGQGSPGLSSVGLAQHVLSVLRDSNADALVKLQHIESGELLDIQGIGPAKAATLIAALELGKRVFQRRPLPGTVLDDPRVAADALAPQLMWETQEHFAVVCLNIKHQLLSTKVLTKGTSSETLAHPKDVFVAALRGNAARIIVAHNHPSGSLSPSRDDITLTRQLLQAANIMGIPLLDHLILGGGDFRSLRQTTMLWQEEPQDEAMQKSPTVNRDE
ncbi:RadC family protein [Leptolyngbya iicbica]|uniref:JAB domain-containing protein n=2 Tax=Cyanophyceae TaxID=3028117 RepID=A0A4Q7E5Q8_9CYAN|nr:DNA repair protein RadC [Leptolyngbya sp. LK]RZM77777.1 JAB domain-containing protein [Leptolyngbya sp. LK]